MNTEVKEVLDRIINTKIDLKCTDGPIELRVDIPEARKQMCTIVKSKKQKFNDTVDAIAYSIKALYNNIKEDE
jgi:hypothetical protein